MGLRISTTRMYHSVTRRLMDSQQRLYDAQEMVSTGKKLRRPSDNPVAFARVAGYKSVREATDQYLRNISFSRGYFAEAESSLQSVANLLARAKELAMQGASGGLDPETLAGAAAEVSGIYDQVLALANARWSGGGSQGTRYVFSGYRSDTPAFTEEGVYQGDGGEYKVEIAPGESITVGFSGGRVFQGGVDVFGVLASLRDGLQAGDTEAVQSTLDDLDLATSQVATALAEIGGRENRLDQTETRLGDVSTTVEKLISADEDADVARAASDLTFYQVALQASIYSTRQIFQTLGIL